MRYGVDIKNLKCYRCHDPISIPRVFRNGNWYHQKCFSEGARQLANATRLATSINGEIIPAQPR